MKPFSGAEKTRIVLVEHSHNFLICLKIFTFPSVLLLTGSRLLEFKQKKKFLKIYCSISVNINCFEQLLHFGLNTLWLKLSSNCKERKALNFSILSTVRTEEHFEIQNFNLTWSWFSISYTACLNWFRVRCPECPDSNRRKILIASVCSNSFTLVWNLTFLRDISLKL